MRTKSLFLDDDVYPYFMLPGNHLISVNEAIVNWRLGKTPKDITRRGISQCIAAFYVLAHKDTNIGMTPEQLRKALTKLSKMYPELYS